MIKIKRGMRSKSFVILFFLLIPIIATSQPGDPGADPDNPVPIGGVEVLLLAGGALGARKIILGRKRNDKF